MRWIRCRSCAAPPLIVSREQPRENAGALERPRLAPARLANGRRAQAQALRELLAGFGARLNLGDQLRREFGPRSSSGAAGQDAACFAAQRARAPLHCAIRTIAAADDVIRRDAGHFVAGAEDAPSVRHRLARFDVPDGAHAGLRLHAAERVIGRVDVRASARAQRAAPQPMAILGDDAAGADFGECFHSALKLICDGHCRSLSRNCWLALWNQNAKLPSHEWFLCVATRMKASASELCSPSSDLRRFFQRITRLSARSTISPAPFTSNFPDGVRSFSPLRIWQTRCTASPVSRAMVQSASTKSF